MSDKQKMKLTKKEKKAMNHAKLMEGKNQSISPNSIAVNNSKV